MSLLHRGLVRVGDRSGKAGRQLALQTDLVSLVGPASAWRWRRHMALKAKQRPAWREERYIELWTSAARAIGATVEDLPGGFLQIRKLHRSTIVWNNLVRLDDPVTLRLAGERAIAHARIAAAGVPVTEQTRLRWTDVEEARAFLRRHGQVVVKPAGPTGRGTGVTCGVRDAGMLDRAMLRASGWDRSVVLERHAEGAEYRLLVLDGEVVGAVRRRPPQVTGDGRRTIGELIDAENRARAAAQGRLGLWPIRVDLDAVLTLRRAGFTLGTVLAAGRELPVKSTANENGAGDNQTIDPVPPALAEVGREVARAVDARLVSVELITPDPETSLADVDGAVIEVNTTPGLLYHVQVADPSTAVNVAVPILETLLGEGAPHAAL